ncbi:hypothetical protein B0H11DRAFT_2251011 [Mycena galericulata]|nr:hypothetical protein B0H11DRAFT_2251011 [Mycena galericulata]
MATRFGFRGTKKEMYAAVQATLSRGLREVNPPPRGYPSNYLGHRLTRPLMNTGKSQPGLGTDGVGIYKQFCRGNHGQGACTASFQITGPLDPEILATPWFRRLFEIRRELRPVPLGGALVQPPPQVATVAPPPPASTEDQNAIDVTTSDFDTPQQLELFPREDEGALYLRLDDFVALFKRKGFGTDLEVYLHDALKSWVPWPLDRPIPVSGKDDIVVLRSQGVNYLEGWDLLEFE